MHEKYNTLSYDGYLYGVKGDCNLKAVRYIIGDVELSAQHSLVGSEANVRFSVRDGRLFINFFKTYVPKGKGKALCCTEHMTASEVDTFAFYERTLVKHVVDEVICDNITRFFPYTGIIVAHQYYIDEIEWGTKTHREESVFYFDDGCLNIEKSIIQRNDEVHMTRFCWDESKRRIPVTVKEGEPAGRRWYFVNPVGSYLQNEHLMNVHVNYCVSRRIKNEWLDEILSAQEPVLRCELMCETEPGANDFLPRTVDLVCVFIQYLDFEKLKRIYEHIQFEKYEDYPQQMLEALLVKSKVLTENQCEDNLRQCIKILELFLRQGLKFKEVERYSKLVLENVHDSHFANSIAELLRQFE